MFYVSGFYKFKKVTNISKIKIDLQEYFNKNYIKGTLIISPEGINGTISAKKNSLNLTIDKIKKTFNFFNFDNLN